jgi:excisionase family DNA binding protein
VEESSEKILWTRKEVAEKLQVSTKTISRLINKGDLPFVQIGSSIRIQKTDVFEFLERQKRYNLGCVESVQSSKGENACDSINVTAFTTLPTNQEVENRLDALLKPKANK